MRMVAIGCLLGFLAVATMPQAQAQAVTPEDIVRRIIEEMKEHPPMSTGDHVVGEQLC